MECWDIDDDLNKRYVENTIISTVATQKNELRILR